MLNHSNNKCLDFAGGNLSNAVTLQQWGCAGPYAHNQQWNWIGVGRYGVSDAYIFQNEQNKTCIAVENNSLANAARVVQRACDASNPSQHWIQLQRGVPGTRTKWMNGRSGKCLDVPFDSDGTVFQQYTCANTQYWAPQLFIGHFEAIGDDH